MASARRPFSCCGAPTAARLGVRAGLGARRESGSARGSRARAAPPRPRPAAAGSPGPSPPPRAAHRRPADPAARARALVRPTPRRAPGGRQHERRRRRGVHRLAEEIAPREEVEALCECWRRAGAAAEGAGGGRPAACQGLGAPGGAAPTGRAGPRVPGGEERPARPAARGCVGHLHTCHRCAAEGRSGRAGRLRLLLLLRWAGAAAAPPQPASV